MSLHLDTYYPDSWATDLCSYSNDACLAEKQQISIL